MNVIIKPKNLINLKNTIESCDDNYILFYKGKSIKFLDDGFFFVYICINSNDISDAKIDCLLNKKIHCSSLQINNKCFIINKIIKIVNKDIISFRNNSNISIKIENINIKVHKIS